MKTLRFVRAGTALALLVPAFSLLVGTGVAYAATSVTLVGSELTVVAGPEELNDVVVTREGDSIVVHDPGVTLTAGPKCAAGGGGTRVACPLAPVLSVRIELGDQDDVVRFHADFGFTVKVVVDGGEGDDELEVGASTFGIESRLQGGEGNDILRGGPGRDVLEGGPGSDTFFGGAGKIDEVLYISRTEPVTADIDGANDDGEANEQDTIMTDVEGISGGAGDDHLTTNPAALVDETYFLFGGRGNNTLTGGPGKDTLLASRGTDVMHGMDGDDFLLIQGESLAHAHGDDGNDRLEVAAQPTAPTSFLFGGPGDDLLLWSSGGTTVMDGGPGPIGDDPDSDALISLGVAGSSTIASYEARTRPVRVSLDGLRNDGDVARGEKDNVQTAAVIGGSGNDWLIDDSSAAHRFFGGQGDDHFSLDDGGPDDEAHGGPGLFDLCELDAADTSNGCETFS